jgi:hypothetical protein
LTWPKGDHFRRHSADDQALARTLFGETARPDSIQGLFEREPLDDPFAEGLRHLLCDWPDLGIDSTDTAHRRADIEAALARLPAFSAQRPERLQHCADRLMLRAFLGQLSWALSSLLPKLAPLEQHELAHARTLRDRLLGFMPWMPSPLGPLAQRELGFGLRSRHDGPKLVEARAFTGDPHGFVSGLGEVTARALAGAPRAVLGLSATGRFPGASRYDVNGEILAFQPDDRNDIRLHLCNIKDPESDGNIRISGISSPERRHRETQRLAGLLWRQVLAQHLTSLREQEATRDRARALIATGSYREARAATEGIAESMRDHREARQRIRLLTRDGESSELVPTLTHRSLGQFAHSEADLLIAPLSVVCRGHNILQPGKTLSALHSIFLLVRPVPQIADPAELLAFVSYRSGRPSDPEAEINDGLAREKRHAEALLHRWQRAVGPFSRLPRQILHAVFCGILVDLTQLAGRARRGNTPADVYLVDGAFEHDSVGWSRLVRNSLRFWRHGQSLDEMHRLHGALLSALESFSS